MAPLSTGTIVAAWDPRSWPFLLTGFLLFLALGTVLIVLGFLFQDRLGLDSATTVRLTGASAFAAGLALIAVQGALVPGLGRPALRLPARVFRTLHPGVCQPASSPTASRRAP